LFPDFAEAVQLADDIHREILIDGALLNKYNARLSSILLDHNHGIRPRTDVELKITPEIPVSAGQAFNHILKQHGLPEVDIQDAEFEEV
jgi:hypothetical protein